MVVKLIFTALYNAMLAILIYIAERNTPFGKMSNKVKQTVIGVLFGLMACFASLDIGGVDIGDGTIMNVRDAAPICAGLIFGAPAGLIAGIIGGVFRYVTAFFGITGIYTQIACSISTVLAGVIAALLRKFMFDDKKPGWIYGLFIGIICEVIHMLTIFFTNASDPATAFGVVKVCSLPMMFCNGFSVGAAVLVISLISRDKKTARMEKKHISRTFQVWLFLCIVIAYGLTGTYTYVLQSQMSGTETESVIKTNVNDVMQDILDTSDENLLEKTTAIKEEYLAAEGEENDILGELAEKYKVAEIQIVDTYGIITHSNSPEYIGFDMSGGAQSAEFMVLLDGVTQSYVQEYQPQTFDGATPRKYGAVTLPLGGFLQVGYDAEEFQADISSTVEKIAKNRHIGENGFIIICDSDCNVVSEGGTLSGENLSETILNADGSARAEDTIFTALFDGTKYLCAYEYVEGYYIFGALPESEALFMRDVSVYLSSFMQMIIFAALFVLLYFLIKKIIIDNLVEVNRSLSKIAAGDLNVTVNVRSNEEFASLSDDINSTVDTLKKYISEAEARIDAELEFAKQIQHSALPSVFPPYPNKKEFDIYAMMDTAKEVGGDFYDFYMLDDSTIAFLIADVSGKGIPAAMFMMKAKTIIKDLAESGLEVNDILTQANNKLCENNDAGMFVTAWMAIVDLKTGIMSVANAGHNPPLICRRDGEFDYVKQRAGFVLAGMDNIKYKKTEIQLSVGDRVFLYTDGITEATNTENQLYGEDRLKELLNSSNDSEPQKLCETVRRDIDVFVGDAPQFDDITMVGFRLDGVKDENRLEFVPNANGALLVSEFSQQLTAKLDIIPKISGKVNIAIDEIASNIINYSKATVAEIICNIENKELHLIFKDNGTPYDPLKAETPDTTLSAEERQIGGLGIFMVKKMTKSMEYKYENGCNILEAVIALE